MGITLTSKTINSTYDSLLKLSDNDSLTGAFKVITDGLGNDTGISVNNNGDVIISNTLDVATKITTPLLQLEGGTGTQGSMSWNVDETTVDLVLNGFSLPIGHQVVFHVKNNSVTTAIPLGTPVYVASTLGASGLKKVAPFIADGSINAKYFLGVTSEVIAADGEGKVTWLGDIKGFNTLTYGEGVVLYPSETVAGGWQTTKPTAPNPKLEIAFTVNAKSNGTITVRGNNGHYLSDLHDVQVSTAADKDLLVYNSISQRWENSKTIGDLTAANLTATSFIKSGGTSSQFLKADGSVDSTSYQDATEKGQALGYAPLDSGGKVAEAYLPDSIVGQVEYQGTWNASTDTPTLPDPTTVKGHFYIVSVAGNYLTIDYQVGDWVISNGVDWSKVDNTDAVTTFNGRLGSIVPLSTDYDSFFYTKTLLDAGQLDNRYYTETELNAGQLDNRYYTETELNAGQLDTRYYTETEINSFFSGGTAISGYNKTNWDTAFGWGNWATGVTKAFVDALNVNADTVDSLHASDFLRSNAADTATGALTFSGVNTFNGSATFNDDITLNHSATGQLVDGITITNVDTADTGVLSVEAGDKLTWNGNALVTTVTAGQYVVNTGDTMTGSLTIENTAPLYKLKDNNSTGANASYGQIQWYDQLDTEIATVGFYGLDSNFYIDAYGSTVVIGDALSVGGTITATGGNSTNWNTAYTYSQVGHLPLAGGTLNGTVNFNGLTRFQGSIGNSNATAPAVYIGLSGGLDPQIQLQGSGGTDRPHIDFANGASEDYDARIILDSDTLLTLNGADFDIADGSLSVGGTITAAGGTSTNWNTAYGWGNWATGVTKTFVDNLNVDADTLDSLDSSQFLRSDTSDAMNGDLSIIGLLDVQKNQNAISNFYFKNTDVTNASSRAYLNLVSGNQSLVFKSINSDHAYIDSSSNLYIQNGGSVSATFLANGNVGIGTTNPSTPLHVVGNVYSTTRFQGGNTLIGSNTISSTNFATLGSNSSGVGIALARDHNAAVYPDLIINSSGNVGIGTSNPDRGLTISRSGQYAALNIKNSFSGNQTIYLGTGSSDNSDIPILQMFDSTVEKIRLYTDGNSWINGGNVGIGTTSPAAKIHSASSYFFVGGSDGMLKMKSVATTYGSETVILQTTIDGRTDDYTASTYGGDGRHCLVFQPDGGRVGVRNIQPAYELDVNGTIRASGDVIAYSDERVKENIETIPNALNSVKEMRGVLFNKIGEEKQSTGVIAQEIEKILPQVVSEDDKGMKSVAYGNIVGVLIEAIKEQQEQIDELKNELKELKSK